MKKESLETNKQLDLVEETSVGKFYWDHENEIVLIEMLENISTVEIAKETVDVEEKVCLKLNINNARILVNLALVNEVSKEARDYLANTKTACNQRQVALLVPTPFSKMIGNFFMGLNKPYFPTKLFNGKEDAINWLHSFPNS